MPIGCLSIETLGCLREQRDPGLVIDRVRRRDVGEQPTAGALQMLRRLLWFHARDDRLSSRTLQRDSIARSCSASTFRNYLISVA